jgi:predicted MarR family transcription regulator
VITGNGTRIPGLRFGDIRVHALLQALLIHRLLPNGNTNRDLRSLIAPLLGTTIEDIAAGKMTYDLRRLRMHGLITRIPNSRRGTVALSGFGRSSERAFDATCDARTDSVAHSAAA